MPFPQPEFTLDDKIGDSVLVTYLGQKDHFAFLSDRTRKEIEKLGEEDRKQRDILLELWPLVITDALRELKRHDPREWPDPDDEKIGTFFDEASLGTTELEEVFDGFSKFEGMMYGASPEQYRGHVVHSFLVWIIGHGLLRSCFNGVLDPGAKLKKTISPLEWECMWAIAALCHDIGYPLSQIQKVNDRAREALRSQGLLPEGDLRFTFSRQMQPFHDTMIRLMASKPVKLAEMVRPPKDKEKEEKERIYVTHLQNKYYLKLLKSFDNLDHGVVSALLTSKGLVYFLESDLCYDWWLPLTKEDARQFLIRREILRAIASHTCPDIYHLKFNTLAFLLCMADEIQCWGRPTLARLQEEPAGIMNGQVKVSEFSPTGIRITITTDDESWGDDLKKSIKEKWVGRLRKMLRLAVGTLKLEKSYLRFQAQNKAGQKCYLELKDGQLIGPKLEG